MTSLLDFESFRPPFETKQEETLNWLVDAHSASENVKNGCERASFQKELEKTLFHVGCKSQWIEKRGHILSDFLHREWEKMEIYRLDQSSTGENLSVRMKHFETFVNRVFENYYPPLSAPPDDLIHVTCTGYVAPSGAQQLVAKREWGSHTTITHAYHMGCYGAFPAIRIGDGFLKSGKTKVDIVHTEICSLHLNPSLHEPAHLVSQSLFSDGFIKYSLLKAPQKPHLKIVAIHEEIIPRSIQQMTWNLVEWGNAISLSKKIPITISRALSGYLDTLCKKASLPKSIIKTAYFAVHPGGPKILMQIQQLLELTQDQMALSFAILKSYGNMSSATLPHIWAAMLQDETVKHQDLLISLAFGPGLNVAGSIMEKRCF